MEQKIIGYSLSELSRLFHRSVKNIANDNGISSTYFQILGFLTHNQDENITQKDICEFVKMKAPTISLTLQNMESEGLIERVKSETDSRCTYVVLTQKGIELNDRVKTFFDITEQKMINSLTKSEYQTLMKCLEKMKTALEE